MRTMWNAVGQVQEGVALNMQQKQAYAHTGRVRVALFETFGISEDISSQTVEVTVSAS